MSAALREPPGRRRWPGIALLGFATLFVVFGLGSTSAWWFEDDPLQFATAASISNPVAIFTDLGVLRRWGTGASLVPMQILSYWIDTHAFGVSATAARVHDAIATIACAFLVYLVLSTFGAPPATAAVAAGSWLCLPATIAVHEFTSARHYMEGLCWSLAAVCVLQSVCRRPPSKSAARWTLLFILLAAAAMLSKETYAASLATFAIPYAIARRRHGIAGGVAVMLLACVAYRFAMLGSADAYPHPAFAANDYLRYLRALPYTLAAGTWGWILVLVLAAAAADAFRRQTLPAARACLLFGAVLAAGLAAAYPTAPAVLLTHETPGTWYRAVFLASTVTLLWGAYLLGRFATPRWRLAALIVAAVVVLPGTVRTRTYWQARLARSEEEGRFYLAHTDRLVYSEEDADWFLPGLDRLYGVPQSHFVSKNQRRGPAARRMLERFPAIWRYGDGRWKPDAGLYAALLTENAAAPEARRP
jgi:hypothetical protein